jgi:hypothetical protein
MESSVDFNFRNRLGNPSRIKSLNILNFKLETSLMLYINMATAKGLAQVRSVETDDDLTDEQIEGLLARATARLKAKNQSSSQDVLKLDGGESYTFPKLETGQLEKPYVSQKDGVASVDASRLVAEQQRKQANGVRKVQDPITAKKMAIEVSFTTFSNILLAMRKSIPYSLEQSPGAVLVCLSAL